MTAHRDPRFVPVSLGIEGDPKRVVLVVGEHQVVLTRELIEDALRMLIECEDGGQTVPTEGGWPIS